MELFVSIEKICHLLLPVAIRIHRDKLDILLPGYIPINSGKSLFVIPEAIRIRREN